MDVCISDVLCYESLIAPRVDPEEAVVSILGELSCSSLLDPHGDCALPPTAATLSEANASYVIEQPQPAHWPDHWDTYCSVWDALLGAIPSTYRRALVDKACVWSPDGRPGFRVSHPLFMVCYLFSRSLYIDHLHSCRFGTHLTSVPLVCRCPHCMQSES
jgi:hypothetical protein